MADTDPIMQRMKKLILDQLEVEGAEIVPEARFIDDLGADSLDIVELVMAIEEEFELEIPDDHAERIATVADAVAYIKEYA